MSDSERGKESIDTEMLDPAKRAAAGIGAVLEEDLESEDVTVVDERLIEKKEARQKREEEAELAAEENLVNVEDELTGASVIEVRSERVALRTLLITREASVMTLGTPFAERVREMASFFAEVHVVVLTVAKRGKPDAPPFRLLPNVYIYTTTSSSWWRTILDARKIAKHQLTFAAGFRTDLIIATDAYESLIAGYLIGKKYKRPVQLHAREDFLDPSFVSQAKHNTWRLRMARHFLPKADCIRTESLYLRDKLIKAFPEVEERTEVFPRYYDLSGWKDAEPTFDVHVRYPTYRFCMLHVSRMNERSHTDRVLNGLARIVKKYKTLGIVLIGDAKYYEMLHEHVKLLGIAEHVTFVRESDADLTSYMKTADALIFSSEDEADEKVLLQAAVSGIPIVAVASGLAEKLFKNEGSAFLCPLDSPPCFGEKINKLLNDNALRKQLSLESFQTAFDSIDQNYDTYFESYRASIERCALRGDERPKT